MLTIYSYLRAALLVGAAGATVANVADSSGANRPATASNATISDTTGQRGIHLAGNGVLDLGADPGGLNALCKNGDYTVIVAFAPDTTSGALVPSIATDATLFAKNAAANQNQTWIYQGTFASNAGEFAFGFVGRYGLDRAYTGDIQAGSKNVFARRVRRIDATHIEETYFLNGRRWRQSVIDVSGLGWSDSAPFTFGGLAGGQAGYVGTIYAGAITSGGTDAEILAQMETVRTDAGLPAFPATTEQAVQIIWIGNSLFQSIGVSFAQRWPRQAAALFTAATNRNYLTVGWGIGGARWSADANRPDLDVTAMYNRLVKPMLAPDRKTYLIIYEDTNQMDPNQAGSTPAQSQVLAAALYAQARADLTAAGDGGTVYRLTCVANTADPAGSVNTLNGLRRAADANATLIDVAGVSELSDPANGTYFIDGTHLQPAGYAKAAAPVSARLVLDIAAPAPPPPPQGGNDVHILRALQPVDVVPIAHSDEHLWSGLTGG